MLRPRIIPCLLVKNSGLVKTVKFSDPKYVGDPINAVRIFNEKEADELIVLDIDATANKSEPNYEMIKNLAAECRMPLCYGGGVQTVDQFKKIINLGVEKVAMSSSAVKSSKLVKKAAEMFGSQSVVVVLDVKRKRFSGKYEVFTYNGKKSSGLNAVDFSRKMASLGAGEIVVNSIDHDGLMEGYDYKLVEQVRNAVNVPITVLGGAGSLDDISNLVDRFGVIGAAAGSLFVFKGKYRAVLINYPDQILKEQMFG